MLAITELHVSLIFEGTEVFSPSRWRGDTDNDEAASLVNPHIGISSLRKRSSRLLKL